MEVQSTESSIDLTAHKNNSYYGRMDESQDTLGVCYMMIDEHVQKIITKRSKQFIKELDDVLKEFKSTMIEKFKAINQKQSSSNSFMKVELKAIQKRLDDRDKKEKKAIELALKAKADKDALEADEAKTIYESLKEKGIIKDKE